MTRVLLFAAALAFAPAVQAQDWSGFYLGAAVSADDYTVDDLQNALPGEFAAKGTGYQGFLGYNWQRGKLVFGGELAVGRTDAEGSDGVNQQPFTATGFRAIRARLGIAKGRFLPYLALGQTRADVNTDHDGFGTNVMGQEIKGTSVALGLDYMTRSNFFLRVELEHTEFQDYQYGFFGGSDVHPMETSSDRFIIGIARKF